MIIKLDLISTSVDSIIVMYMMFALIDTMLNVYT